MSRLLKIFFCLFLFLTWVKPILAAGYIGTCSADNEIKQDANDWLYKQPGFKPPNPPPPYTLYNPYIKKNYAANEHRDNTILPRPEALACLIVYAKEEWHDNMGTGFDEQGANQVINFAATHQYNP